MQDVHPRLCSECVQINRTEESVVKNLLLAVMFCVLSFGAGVIAEKNCPVVQKLVGGPCCKCCCDCCIDCNKVKCPCCCDCGGQCNGECGCLTCTCPSK